MDIVVCFESLPKIGGAHMWMYEAYRRWPGRAVMLTGTYDASPAEAAKEREFDARDHGSLSIVRAAPTAPIELRSPRFWAATLSQVRQIGRCAGGGRARLHAVRAFPEGLPAAIYRALHPRSRLITYAHGEELLVALTSRQITWMARTVFGRSDLVIVNSENTRRMLAELCPGTRTVCIHPGVSVADYTVPDDAARRYRERLGWPADTIVVATVARMEPRKNQAMVLRAIARLRGAGASVGYICGGDGEEREALQTLARELGIERWVRFTGRVSDEEKRLIFATCDIHAMPSIRVGSMIEGFGIVFIEAAAAGKPSLAGNLGGQREAVLDGETGLVVDGTSLDAVAAALARLAGDAGLRSRMGAAARRWAAENDWDRIAERTAAAAATL